MKRAITLVKEIGIKTTLGFIMLIVTSTATITWSVQSYLNDTEIETNKNIQDIKDSIIILKNEHVLTNTMIDTHFRDTEEIKKDIIETNEKVDEQGEKINNIEKDIAVLKNATQKKD